MHFQSLPGSAQASSLTQQNSTQQQKTTNKFNHYYHFVQVLPIKITMEWNGRINWNGMVELIMFLWSFKCLKDEISS